MNPISDSISGAIYSPSTAANEKAPSNVQRPEDKTQSAPTALARDEYIPEEKREPSGRYWLGRDEDGKPRVYFDDPKRAADASEKREALPAADDPEQDDRADGPKKKASGGKAESSTCNTDEVDREIEKLKKKQAELEREIHSETDDAKAEKLEKELAQVERELRQKDNDAYRRRHAVVS